MTMREQDLDDLLAAARKAPFADPSPDLLARVLADSYEAQPAPAKTMLSAPMRRAGFFARFVGFPALTGLAAATVGGLWFGFAAPSALAGVTDSLGLALAGDTVELMPEFPQFLTEGS